jgi:hypothetical protein
MNGQDYSAELMRALERMDVDYAPLGRVEHQREWACEDGWYVFYTTSKVIGGSHDGKFLVQAFKPVGKGSRSGKGKAEQWVEAYSRAFVKRQAAKNRALELFAQHSPKWAARHGRGVKQADE